MEYIQGFFMELVFLYVCLQVVEVLWAWGVSSVLSARKTTSTWHTRKMEIPQGALVSFEMIIDAESLIIPFQGAEFAYERKVLSRVLK